MFIFFDLDDTLGDHQTAVELAVSVFHQRFAQDLTLSGAEFLKSWREISDNTNELYLQGKMSLIEIRREHMREVFADTGRDLSTEEADDRFQVYLEHYEANWKPFDDVVPCLDRLSNDNLGLISNGDFEQQHRKLKQAQLKDRFSTIVISSEIGVHKPTPKIFLEACRRAKVDPRDAFYVGDSFNMDVLPSRAVGMTGVWLNRKDLPLPNLDAPVIKSLYECEKLWPRNSLP